MTRLVVIVPTRGRPHNVRPLVEAFTQTATADTQLVMAIDGDPQNQQAYAQAWGKALGGDHPHRLWTFSERMSMCPRLNLTAEMVLAEHGDDFVIGFMGDDHRPRTVGWDQRILDAMTSLGVVYTADGIQNENLPTSVYMDGQLVRRLGWMVPPGITHLYCDNAWKNIGEALGTLTYLADVLIEHMHPIASKAPMDVGYAEVNSPQRYEDDRAAYRQWLTTGLVSDMQRVVRGAMH
jgi:hypothetical protein